MCGVHSAHLAPRSAAAGALMGGASSGEPGRAIATGDCGPATAAAAFLHLSHSHCGAAAKSSLITRAQL